MRRNWARFMALVALNRLGQTRLPPRGRPVAALQREQSSDRPSTPGGRRAWMPAVSDRGRMPSRKMPIHGQARACALAGKAFFFGSFLLALSKRNEPVRFSGRRLLPLTHAVAFIRKKTNARASAR